MYWASASGFLPPVAGSAVALRHAVTVGIEQAEAVLGESRIVIAIHQGEPQFVRGFVIAFGIGGFGIVVG